jgi:RNA polymerase sigma-70 factor, ECF subfamily
VPPLLQATPDPTDMANKSEFDSTVLPHLDSVFRGALAVSRDRQMAEDLTQTTILKALERFGSFREGSNCKAWLLRIMRNTWIDILRHRKVVGPQVSVEEQLLAEDEEPDLTAWSDARDLIENFSDEDVINALLELPEDQRLTLYLSDVEQLKHEEVGEIMDVAVGTVKSRTSRARSELKKKLMDHAKDLGLAGERMSDE